MFMLTLFFSISIYKCISMAEYQDATNLFGVCKSFRQCTRHPIQETQIARCVFAIQLLVLWNFFGQLFDRHRNIIIDVYPPRRTDI